MRRFQSWLEAHLHSAVGVSACVGTLSLCGRPGQHGCLCPCWLNNPCQAGQVRGAGALRNIPVVQSSACMHARGCAPGQEVHARGCAPGQEVHARGCAPGQEVRARGCAPGQEVHARGCAPGQEVHAKEGAPGQEVHARGCAPGQEVDSGILRWASPILHISRAEMMMMMRGRRRALRWRASLYR